MTAEEDLLSAPRNQSIAAPPSSCGSDDGNYTTGSTAESAGPAEAIRQLQPFIKDLSKKVAQIKDVLIEENDESQSGAQQANMLAQSYNAAAPVSNGVWSFLKDVDTATGQAGKVADFEGREDGEFDENIQEAASAVTMISQVLKNLKDVILPRLMLVNGTLDNLYNESDRISEIFNGNARRLTDLQNRSAVLKQELDKSNLVYNVLIEYSTHHQADRIAAAEAAGKGVGDLEAPIPPAPSLLEEQNQAEKTGVPKRPPSSLLEEMAKAIMVPRSSQMQVLREWQAKKHPFSTTGMAVTALSERNVSESFQLDIPSLEAPTASSLRL